jgi:hypothetical protein
MRFIVISCGPAKLNASFLLRCYENCARFFSCNAPALSANRNKKVARKISGIRLPWNVFAMPGPVNEGKDPFLAGKQNKYEFGTEIAFKVSKIIPFFFFCEALNKQAAIMLLGCF